jgi:myo-inositol 2-dehydrogenase/D-chiro-inositol 1-dehydrogenase
MSDEDVYKIAPFGAGRIGKVHSRSIADHPATRLKYVVDPIPGPVKALADSYGAICVDEATALNDPDIAAIVIGSATSTHADLVEKGLKAGKAVFCEKPIDLSIARVNACLAALKDCKAPLFVAFNRRFDPAVTEMRRRIAAGDIGPLELVTVISKDPGALPLEYLAGSGGMFRNMTIHDFDLARYILGEEPVTVSAMASALTDSEIAGIGDIDTACVTMQCASGRIAVITNSRRASYGYDQRIEAHGALGTLRTENVPVTTGAGTRRRRAAGEASLLLP